MLLIQIFLRILPLRTRWIGSHQPARAEEGAPGAVAPAAARSRTKVTAVTLAVAVAAVIKPKLAADLRRIPRRNEEMHLSADHQIAPAVRTQKSGQ